MIRYSRGRGITDNHPEQREAPDFAAFVDALDGDRAPQKAGAAYFCGPLNGDGRRCAEGALPRRVLATDLDRIDAERHADVRLWFAQRFSGCAWPTHSSKPEAPRERVLIELDREASRDECIAIGRVLMADLAAEFGDDVLVDDSTFRPEQPVFLPPAGVRLAKFEGPPLKVDEYLAAAPAALPAEDKPQEAPAAGGSVTQGRNNYLSRRAFGLRKDGLSPEAILPVLLALNREVCKPPLDNKEVEGIAHRKRSVPVAAAPEAPEQRFALHDAAALLKQEIKPVNYVVPEWIPEGLLLLAAAPKVGKSTLILQVAVCKAAGLPFWGADVPEGKVLMIDLETNERRLRRKLEGAGVTSLKSGQLLYATEWPRGLLGVERIAQTLDADPGIKLVVIDTLQRFRDSGKSGQNAYAADYEALAPLQQLCRERSGLAIVCVHHKRKAASDDPIDSINGSAAIAGAADGIWLMSRKGSDYILHVQARDWERDEDEFRIERDAGQWRLVDGPRYSANEAEVLRLLDAAGGMTGPQLGEALGVHRVTAHERLKRMEARGLVRYADGAWRACV